LDERVRFQDLRHTFATQLLIAGAPAFVVQELLGHSSVEMTRRYSHVTEELKHRAVASLRVKTVGKTVEQLDEYKRRIAGEADEQ
jgi:site-specific recombinase XerD